MAYTLGNKCGKNLRKRTVLGHHRKCGHMFFDTQHRVRQKAARKLSVRREKHENK